MQRRFRPSDHPVVIEQVVAVRGFELILDAEAPSDTTQRGNRAR